MRSMQRSGRYREDSFLPHGARRRSERQPVLADARGRQSERRAGAVPDRRRRARRPRRLRARVPHIRRARPGCLGIGPSRAGKKPKRRASSPRTGARAPRENGRSRHEAAGFVGALLLLGGLRAADRTTTYRELERIARRSQRGGEHARSARPPDTCQMRGASAPDRDSGRRDRRMRPCPPPRRVICHDCVVTDGLLAPTG